MLCRCAQARRKKLPPPLFWNNVDFGQEKSEQNLCCVFGEAGDRKTLSRLTLAVRHNEILGLLGPARSGKSAAFELAAGHCAPLDGFVRSPPSPALWAIFAPHTWSLNYAHCANAASEMFSGVWVQGE